MSPTPALRTAAAGLSFGDEGADTLGGLDEMAIGEVRVGRGRSVAPMSEQLTDLGPVLASHDGLAGWGVIAATFVGPFPAKRCSAGPFLSSDRTQRLARRSLV